MDHEIYNGCYGFNLQVCFNKNIILIELVPGASRNPRQPPDTRKHEISKDYHENKDKLYTDDIKYWLIKSEKTKPHIYSIDIYQRPWLNILKE